MTIDELVKKIINRIKNNKDLQKLINNGEISLTDVDTMLNNVITKVKNNKELKELLHKNKEKDLSTNTIDHIENSFVNNIKKNKKYMPKKYMPKTKEELQALVDKDYINLKDIDTRYIDDMSNLFMNSDRTDYTGIETWDTSFVTNMNNMFYKNNYIRYEDLSKWDTSRVVYMNGMFAYSSFNGNISKWNTGKVKYMEEMFAYSKFNGNISKWNVSKVVNMVGMFRDSEFNQDISNWNTSSVINMTKMFSNSIFNKDISNWNTKNVKIMDFMFHKSKFNGDISNWNVSNVKSMTYMFFDSKFNQDISNWDISSLENDNRMFDRTPLEKNPPFAINNTVENIENIKYSIKQLCSYVISTYNKIYHNYDFNIEKNGIVAYLVADKEFTTNTDALNVKKLINNYIKNNSNFNWIEKIDVENEEFLVYIYIKSKMPLIDNNTSKINTIKNKLNTNKKTNTISLDIKSFIQDNKTDKALQSLVKVKPILQNTENMVNIVTYTKKPDVLKVLDNNRIMRYTKTTKVQNKKIFGTKLLKDMKKDDNLKKLLLKLGDYESYTSIRKQCMITVLENTTKSNYKIIIISLLKTRAKKYM